MWAKVVGPATAFVATCARIGWEIYNATSVCTDVGRQLDLTLDPPAVIERHVREAVVRWRWKKIEAQFPELAINGSGRGAIMQPIWSLLESKQNDPVASVISILK